MMKLFYFPDREKDYQSYMVYMLSIFWTVVIGGTVSFGFIFFPEIWPRWLTFLAISIFIAVFNLTLTRYKYTHLASWSLTLMIWLLITIPCYTAGGIMAPGILFQVSVMLTAGFLLGRRGGLAIGLLTMGTDFLLAYMEVNGYLPISSVIHTPITRWIASIIPFSTVLALQLYGTNQLRGSLIAFQREALKREEAEELSAHTANDLNERVKELRTLYRLSRILQDENNSILHMVHQIAQMLPSGWQYPEIAAARVCIAGIEYSTNNFKPAVDSLHVELKTKQGTSIRIEVVYLSQVPESDKGPFLKEERNLINMLAEMIKVSIESRQHKSELEDYKHALDVASIFSIVSVDGNFLFVNDNFCKTSKYTSEELYGKHHSLIWSDLYSSEYFEELKAVMQNGTPFRGEFCNKAKDGVLYWVDASIVPFLDESGRIYQYVSISYDITERKNADDKIKESERLLKKITSQVPGNTYVFEIEESGLLKFLYINKGTDIFNHEYNCEEIIEFPKKLRDVMHDDDQVRVNEAMKGAYKTNFPISIQYRIVVNDQIRWRWMQAVPEKDKNGKVLWYGATSDITPLVDYIASIEQTIFDLGHVIRRPVSTMLGMSKLVIDTNLNLDEIKEISANFYHLSNEMDKFIRELNETYQKKRQATKFGIDITPIIDKRSSLFN
nr:PAS domain-containing protein [Cytophagales bacterium]